MYCLCLPRCLGGLLPPPLPPPCLSLSLSLHSSDAQNFFDAGVAFYPTAPSVGMRTRVPTLFVFGGSDEYTLPQAVSEW